MDNKSIEEILSAHGVRPTAVRMLIYRCMASHSDTFSLGDLEQELETVDKSTLFRTLTLFTEHHLLHETEDGSGVKKYCVCHNDHSCTPAEMHLGGISLLSPEYLLSFERWPFHAEPPDHYALVSYLIDLSVSQSSTLMPLHSTTGYQSV